MRCGATSEPCARPRERSTLPASRPGRVRVSRDEKTLFITAFLLNGCSSVNGCCLVTRVAGLNTRDEDFARSGRTRVQLQRATPTHARRGLEGAGPRQRKGVSDEPTRPDPPWVSGLGHPHILCARLVGPAAAGTLSIVCDPAPLLAAAATVARCALPAVCRVLAGAANASAFRTESPNAEKGESVRR
jgi:hypothetical protein